MQSYCIKCMFAYIYTSRKQKPKNHRTMKTFVHLANIAVIYRLMQSLTEECIEKSATCSIAAFFLTFLIVLNGALILKHFYSQWRKQKRMKLEIKQQRLLAKELKLITKKCNTILENWNRRWKKSIAFQ